MSRHYLLDIYQSGTGHGRIKDVTVPPAGSYTYIDGTYVVRVTDDIEIPASVDSPTTLITEKYSGMLANSGLFTRIIYDDMLDPAGINMAASQGLGTGMRGSCCLFPDSAMSTPGYPKPTMQFNMVTVPMAPVATQAMIYWEVNKYNLWDVSNIPPFHAIRRSYEEVDESYLICEVSFNNGSTWLVANHGVLFNIPVADQGYQVIVRFFGCPWPPNERLYLGSWALLY